MPNPHMDPVAQYVSLAEYEACLRFHRGRAVNCRHLIVDPQLHEPEKVSYPKWAGGHPGMRGGAKSSRPVKKTRGTDRAGRKRVAKTFGQGPGVTITPSAGGLLALGVVGVLFSVVLWGFAGYGVYCFVKRKQR